MKNAKCKKECTPIKCNLLRMLGKVQTKKTEIINEKIESGRQSIDLLKKALHNRLEKETNNHRKLIYITSRIRNE